MSALLRGSLLPGVLSLCWIRPLFYKPRFFRSLEGYFVVAFSSDATDAGLIEVSVVGFLG